MFLGDVISITANVKKLFHVSLAFYPAVDGLFIWRS